MYKQKVLITILGITVLATLFYWQPTQGYDRVNENDFWNYPLNTTYFGETDVIWSAGPAKSYPAERVEVIAGKAQITNFYKKTQQQQFTVIADGDARLVSHTQYFPGWRVKVDGQTTPIEFQDQNWRGEITFAVPPGTHSVILTFGESRIRAVGDALSVVSIIILPILYIVMKKRTPKIHHAT